MTPLDWVVEVRHARTLVIEALLCEGRAQRYLQAHRAAEVAAGAAVLARTGRTVPQGLVDPWPLVARTVPGLGEWATYFSATQRRCQAVGSGRQTPSEREVDDMLRDVDLFCEAVVECAGRRAVG